MMQPRCTVVLPGDVLEKDLAEYFISEKNFQVKYECTINRKQRPQVKKSKTLLNPVSGNAIDRFKRKINELSDTVGNHGDMMIKRFKENVTAQKVEYDLEAGEGPLPTLLGSQGMIAEKPQKAKRTNTIDWQDIEAAYTYGYLQKEMPESQLTQCLRSSYGHLDDAMDSAVFIHYRGQGCPEAWLCLLVEDTFERFERDNFVKSLNAHAESAKKRQAEQAQ